MESKNIKSIFSYKNVAFFQDNDHPQLLNIDVIRPLIESVATRGHALGITTVMLGVIMDVLCMGIYITRVSSVHIALRGECKLFYWPRLRMSQQELMNNRFLPPPVVERFKEVWAFIFRALQNTWSRMGPLRVTLRDQYESGGMSIDELFHFDYRGINSYDPFSPLNGQITIPDYPYIMIEANNMRKKISIKKNPSCQVIVKKAHNLFTSTEVLPFIMTVYSAKCNEGVTQHNSAVHHFGASPLFDKHLVRSIMQFLHM